MGTCAHPWACGCATTGHKRSATLALFCCTIAGAAPVRAQAVFQGLGDLPGGAFDSVARAVSADGLTVAGQSRSGAAGEFEPFRWTVAGGTMQGLGALPSPCLNGLATVGDISADGNVVVGVGLTLELGGCNGEGYRWEGGPLVGLGVVGNATWGVAKAVSQDGSIIAGYGAHGGDLDYRTWRWEAGIMSELFFGGQPRAISRDGSIVVGWADFGGGEQAFRWTSGTGAVLLGDLPGGTTESSARDISADDLVIVGWGVSASGYEAFSWTQAGGFTGLGDLPGGVYDSRAEGVSQDGTIIVGASAMDASPCMTGQDEHESDCTAFIWDAVNGMRDLKGVLISDYGLDMTGWTLTWAWDVSDDGNTIVGTGINPSANQEAWIVRLEPTRIYVDADATGADDGTSWADAYNNLQNALGDPGAVPGSQIWVADGTYMPDGGYAPVGGLHVDGSGDRSATFRLINGVGLYGGFAGGETDLNERNIEANETILSGDLTGNDTPVACTRDSPDCDQYGVRCVDGFCIISASNDENSHHVVTGSGTDGTAVLDGFIITAAKADGVLPRDRGGGMYNDGGTPTTNNCTFRGNAAESYGAGMYNGNGSDVTIVDCVFDGNSAGIGGGGMYNKTSSPALTDCTFSYNAAVVSGGAMRNYLFADATLLNCTFTANSSGGGGAVWNRNSNPTMINCTFTRNFADMGGAVDDDAGATLINCPFTGNLADAGGAVHVHGGSPVLTNCIFSGNVSTGDGGAVDATILGAQPVFTNCTFSGNVAAGSGGGLYSFNGADPTLDNCIFWGNEDIGGSDSSAQIDWGVGDAPTVNYSTVQGGWSGPGGTGMSSSDPLFVRGPSDGGNGWGDDPGTPGVDEGANDDFGDLRLSTGSPAIDAGDNDALPADTYDLDGDLDTTEELPIDLNANDRRVEDPATDPNTGNPGSLGPPVVDMGAYEYLPRVYVNGGNGPPGANDGTSWADAYDDLQDALADPNVTGGAVHEIWVAAGVYKPDQGAGQTPGDRYATFQLLNGVAIYGGFYGDETSLEQRNIEANETILSGDLLADDDPTPASDCCSAGGGQGCGDGTCEAAVCAQRPRCCNTGWDERCGLLGSILCCEVCGSTCDNAYHVVTGSATDATAVLDGFTITAGNADGVNPHDGGGGMFNSGGSPTLANCTFNDNSASQKGGGMYNLLGSSPSLTDCTFSGNMADYGGGMRNYSNSNPILTGCTFTGNVSPRGGGMENWDGCNPTLVNCTFSGNSAPMGDGGGMRNWINSSPTLTNCTFTNNTAAFGGAMLNFDGASPNLTNCAFNGNSGFYYGGAMHNTNSAPTMTNCAFSGNSAWWGGGIGNYSGSDPIVTNCTFSNNTATGFGGGIYNGTGEGRNSPFLENCVFWENSDAGGSDESAQIHTDIGTTTVRYSIVQGGWSGPGVSNLNADPLFVDADGADDIAGTQDDDLRLLAGSPAIDAADTTALPLDTHDLDDDGNTSERLPLDLDGNPRVLNDPDTPDTGVPGSGVVDMGAFEYFGDCNGNGLPDECDLNCGLPDGPCDIPGCGQSADCQPNGIPDECDIAACPGIADCDDCNLNGVPDLCDDPVDSIPDTCVEWTDSGATDNWSDGGNWSLGGGYPDNVPGTTYSVTLQGSSDSVVLDVDVDIDTLRVLNGARLDVTGEPGAGSPPVSLTVVSAGGIVIDGGPATARVSLTTPLIVGTDDTLNDTNMVVANGGQLLVEGNATIALTGKLTVDSGGRYSAVATATDVTASLTAAEVEIVGGTCVPAISGGEVILTDKMSVITTGDLVMSGVPQSGCPSPSRGGCDTPPPRLIVGGGVANQGRPAASGERSGAPTLEIGGSLLIVPTTTCVAIYVQGSAARGPGIPPVVVGADFINQSTKPFFFDWSGGGLALAGATEQKFEVAGENPTTLPPDLYYNFHMGSVRIDPWAIVRFVDRFDNDEKGQIVQEALYVTDLTFGVGSTVIVDNCSVFYGTLTDNGVTPILEGSGVILPAMPFPPPALAAGAHLVRKNRYFSIDPSTNGSTPVALKVRLVSVKRCSGQPTRACVSNADCEAAVPGSGTCVQHSDVGTAGPWWVQAPQQEELGCLPGPCGSEDWFARVDSEPYFAVWTPQTLHVGDCEVIPVATYDVLACLPPGGTVCSTPLTVGTIVQPFVAPGFRGNYGDVAGSVDPITEEFTQPDGFTNVVDISAYILTKQNYGTPNNPQTHPTWLDLQGNGPGNPPQYILNVSDLGQIKRAFAGDAWTDDPGNMTPGQCP